MADEIILPDFRCYENIAVVEQYYYCFVVICIVYVMVTFRKQRSAELKLTFCEAISTAQGRHLGG